MRLAGQALLWLRGLGCGLLSHGQTCSHCGRQGTGSCVGSLPRQLQDFDCDCEETLQTTWGKPSLVSGLRPSRHEPGKGGYVGVMGGLDNETGMGRVDYVRGMAGCNVVKVDCAGWGRAGWRVRGGYVCWGREACRGRVQGDPVRENAACCC